MKPRYLTIILCIVIAAAVVGTTAGVLFARGKNRAIAEIPPELAIELLSPHWSADALNASSLRFYSAKYSDNYTIVTYCTEPREFSEQESTFLFRFAKIGNEPIHLLDITKVVPYGQNLVVWTTNNQK